MCFGVFVQTNEGSDQAVSRPVGYIIQENGCWDWVGALNADGYGLATVAPGVRRSRQAHRIMYQKLVGPIPEGLQLDHLCRNRKCVNPGHLEPVTAMENTHRGTGLTAQNARKTHCKKGHAFDITNTHAYSDKGKRGRRCRACGRKSAARREAARRDWALRVLGSEAVRQLTYRQVRRLYTNREVK